MSPPLVVVGMPSFWRQFASGARSLTLDWRSIVSSEIQNGFWELPEGGKSNDHPIARIFRFVGQGVRVFDIDGEPWWVLMDITTILEYRMASDAARLLRSNQKGTLAVRTLGGEQKVTIISESGLFRLIRKSKSPMAEKFCDWVDDDLLPTIRKTGRYRVKDHRAERTKKMKTKDPETIETREFIVVAVKDGNRLAQKLEAKTGKDYAIVNAAPYIGQFNQNAAQLKHGLEFKDTPLNHMSKVALATHLLARVTTMQRAEEARKNGIPLDCRILANGFQNAAKEFGDKALQQLGPDHQWQFIEDTERGRIIGAAKQLTDDRS